MVDTDVHDSESFPAKYDLLLIDEGQDFEPERVAAGVVSDDAAPYHPCALETETDLVTAIRRQALLSQRTDSLTQAATSP